MSNPYHSLSFTTPSGQAPIFEHRRQAQLQWDGQKCQRELQGIVHQHHWSSAEGIRTRLLPLHQLIMNQNSEPLPQCMEGLLNLAKGYHVYHDQVTWDLWVVDSINTGMLSCSTTLGALTPYEITCHACIKSFEPRRPIRVSETVNVGSWMALNSFWSD
jgi:hypothetical protein